MKLNKLLTVLGSLALVAGVGCAKQPKEVEAKLGLGYYTKLYSSYGTPEADFTAAAVVFDEDGAVVKAYLDVAQVKFEHNEVMKDGVNTIGLKLKSGATRADYCVKTKLELGDDYGMKSSSQIGKEVDDQIAAFVDWTIGKTIAEIKGGVSDSTEKLTDAAMLAKCSIKVSDFVKAYEVAAREANLKEFSYAENKDIKVGLAMNAGPGYNYGKASTEITCDLGAVVTVDSEVVAANIDGLVCAPQDFNTNLAVPAANKYNSNDNTKAWTSKKDLGDKYAMKGNEGCTKEWFEQAAIIENAAVGKTSTEIASLTKNTGDLVGATITVDSYVRALSNAAK